MGRWLTTLLLVIVSVVAAVLIVPSLIDWTAFRAPIEREASRLVGREVTINGDIHLRMLPSPGLILGKITIADPSSSAAPLVSADRIEASAAWLPLFMGRIEIAELDLSAPIVRVRIHADGTTNWSQPDMRLRLQRTSLPAPAGSFRSFFERLPRGFGPLSISAVMQSSRMRFSDVRIERGTLLFADERNGATGQATSITGRFHLKRSDGPLVGAAALVIDGQPLQIGLNISSLASAAPTPASLSLAFTNGNGALTISGTVSGLSDAIAAKSAAPLTYLGRIDLAAQKSGAVGLALLALAEFDAPPSDKAAAAPWRRIRSLPVSLTGTLDLSKDALALTNARGALGKTTGTITFTRGRQSAAFSLALTADVLYLDDLVDFTPTSGMRFAPLGAASGPMQSLGACRCEGEASFTAPLVMFGATQLGDLKVDAPLSPQGAELAQGHIGLPGSSSLDLTGKLTARGTSGIVFDGALAFKSDSPRQLLQLIGVPIDRLSPNAFKALALDGPFKLVTRAASAESGLRGTQGDQYVVPELDGAKLTLDDQSFTLTAGYDDRSPGWLLFHLDGNWLDADAYGLGALWLPQSPLSSEGWARTVWGHAAQAGDVDVAVTLASMRLARHSMTGFSADVTRVANGPASAHLHIADLSGYKLAFAGTRAKRSGDAPPDMSADLTISGPGQPVTLPLAGKALPGALALDVSLDQSGGAANYTLHGTIGEIKLSGTGSGPASSEILPDVENLKLTAHLSQGDVVTSGSLSGLTVAPTFEGNVTVDAMDFAAFMRELGYSYEPRRKDLGSLSIVSELTATGQRVDVTTFAASVGEDNLNASGTLVFGQRDKLSADIKIGRASLEGYLPAPDKATPWSTERLKIDVLHRFDAAIKLAADRFVIGPYDLRDLAAGLSIINSSIEMKGAKARLYDGALTLDGAADLTDDGITGTLRGTLAGLDWIKASGKLFPALGASGAGKADAQFAVNATGRSLFELVRSLSGTMNISGSGGALDGFDLAGFGNGLGGVSGADAFLRLVKSALGRGSTGVDSFHLGATAGNGVIRVGSGRLAFSGGTGTLDASIDVPHRTMLATLLVQPTEHQDITVGLVAAGPIAGPARSYDFHEIVGAAAQRLGIPPGGIRAQDLPRDLRSLSP